jgi:hypothetical protein
MKSAIFVPLAISFLIGSVFAADVNVDPTMLGTGNDLCKQWIDDLAQPVQPNSQVEQWLLGVVSGHNLFFAPTDQSAFLKNDETSLIDFFREYCEENPEKRIFEAVQRFFLGDLETVKLRMKTR